MELELQILFVREEFAEGIGEIAHLSEIIQHAEVFFYGKTALFAHERGHFIEIFEQKDGDFGIRNPGFPEEGDMVDVCQGEIGKTKALLDGFDWNAAIMFLARESFLFYCEDNLAIDDDGSSRIVAITVKSEYIHAANLMIIGIL